MKGFVQLSIILLWIFLSGTAYAQTCSISTTDVNFGTYDTFSGIPSDSTGSITVTCGPPPPPHVTITIGQSSNSGFIPRKMRALSGSDFLNYNLFTDASRSSVWGDGTGGTSVVKTIATPGKPGLATVYGRISAGQDVSAGAYSETLTVTVTW